jgi:hypothetical protein
MQRCYLKEGSANTRYPRSQRAHLLSSGKKPATKPRAFYNFGKFMPA